MHNVQSSEAIAENAPSFEILMDEAATAGGSNDQILTLLKEHRWFDELNDSLETVSARLNSA
jgi:hypothetical protein